MVAWNKVSKHSICFVYVVIFLSACGGGASSSTTENILAAPDQQAALEASQPNQQAGLEAMQQAEQEAALIAEQEAAQAAQQAALEAEQQAALEAAEQAALEAEQKAALEAEQQAALEAEQQAALEAALLLAANIGEPENVGPFNDYTIQARIAYTGKDAELGLSKESTGQFLTNALFGIPKDAGSLSPSANGTNDWLAFSWDELLVLPQADINGLGITMPHPGTRDCYLQGKSGSVHTEYSESIAVDGYNRLQYDINYEGCPDSIGSVYNGHVVVDYERHSPSGQVRNIFVAFDKMVFDIDGYKLEVNGTVTWAEPRQCELGGAKTYFLNAKDLHTGKSVFLENVKTALIGAPSSYCQTDHYHPNHVSGRILNSDFGAVSIATPIPTQLPIPKLNVSWATDHLDPGAIVLNSATDTAEFSLSTYNPNGGSYETTNDLIKVAKLTLNSDLYPDELDYSQNAELFIGGGLLDLEDDDDDGMNNSWERLSGLNPTDPSDQDSDDDFDGRTALFEFQHLGIANIRTATGDTLNRALSLSFSASTSGGTFVGLHLHSTNPGSLYPDATHSVSLTASKAGDWNYGNSDCSVSINDNMLTCVRTANDIEPASIEFTPVSDGHITFEAATDVPENDYDSSNNAVTLTTIFTRIRSDIEIFATEKFVTSKDIAGSFFAFVAQPLGFHTVPVEVTITFPPELTILSAKHTLNDPEYLNDCDIGDVVVCTWPSIRSGQTFNVKLQYLATEPGDYSVNWEVAPVEHEEEFDNNSAVTTLRVTRHTNELQPIVDAAFHGDEITLPPGIYRGQLNLRNKQLTVQGADGIEPTILYTTNQYQKSIFNVGDQSIIRNMHFQSQGTPIVYDSGDYLTVENSVFEPVPDSLAAPDTDARIRPVVSANLGGGRRDAHLRFVNNRVEGNGTSGAALCSGVLETIGWKSIIIDNNTFNNLDCTYGVFTGEQYWLGDGTISETAYIGNNTFNNITLLVDHEFYSPYYSHVSRIENNVFSNVSTFISDDASTAYLDSGNAMVTSNNIVFNSERATVLPPLMSTHASGLVEAVDIQTDPLFTDVQNSDFTLQPLSPAIDAGITPTIDVSGFNYNYTVDYVDGLQNGLAQPDIGAYEFR